MIGEKGDSVERGPVTIEEIPGTSFTCSFCGRSAWAGFIDDKPSVAHELPTCPQFDTLEPDEFVSACAQVKLTQESSTAHPKAPN